MFNFHSFETFGTQDGPGIRLVVFLQGCDFKCLYCHNPDTISCEMNKEINEDVIIEQLEKGKEFYKRGGGLTVSGGEPTIQAGSLIKLFQKAHSLGYHCCLDTNGSIFNDITKKLFLNTDLVLLDVKHIDERKHKIITGKSNKETLKTAKFLEENNIKMWLRYVLVPNFSDDLNDVENWAKHFTDYKNIERVEVLPYHTLGKHKYKELGWEYKLEGVEPPSAEKIKKVEKIFKKYLKKVVIR